MPSIASALPRAIPAIAETGSATAAPVAVAPAPLAPITPPARPATTVAAIKGPFRIANAAEVVAYRAVGHLSFQNNDATVSFIKRPDGELKPDRHAIVIGAGHSILTGDYAGKRIVTDLKFDPGTVRFPDWGGELATVQFNGLDPAQNDGKAFVCVHVKRVIFASQEPYHACALELDMSEAELAARGIAPLALAGTSLAVGDAVSAVGLKRYTPMGQGVPIMEGKVQARSQISAADLGGGDHPAVAYKTNVYAQAGDSGGPLLNASGAIAGMVWGAAGGIINRPNGEPYASKQTYFSPAQWLRDVFVDEEIDLNRVRETLADTSASLEAGPR